MLRQLKQNLSQVDWELEQLKEETERKSSVQYWETASVPTTNRSVGSITNSALNTDRSGIGSARINTERYQDISFSNSISELQQWKRKLISQNVRERVVNGIEESIESYFKKKKELQQKREESKHMKLFGTTTSSTTAAIQQPQRSIRSTPSKKKNKTRSSNSSKYVFVNGNRIHTLPISTLPNFSSPITQDSISQYDNKDQIESTKDQLLLDYLSTVVVCQQEQFSNNSDTIQLPNTHSNTSFPITSLMEHVEEYNDQNNGAQTTKQYLEKNFQMKHSAQLTDKPFIRKEYVPISSSLKKLKPTSARSFNKTYERETIEKRPQTATTVNIATNSSLYKQFTSNNVLDLVKKLKSTFDFPTVSQTPKLKTVKPEVKIANQFKTFQMEEHRLHK